MLLQHETLLSLVLRLSLSPWQRKAFLGSSPLCMKRLACCRCLVEGSVRGEIIYADEDCFNELFTAVVSVQKCFSKCYFEMVNTIFEMFKEVSFSFQHLCGLWTLLLHK